MESKFFLQGTKDKTELRLKQGYIQHKKWASWRGETYEYQKAKSASSVPGGRTAQIAYYQNHICIHFWPQPQLVFLRTHNHLWYSIYIC